MGRSKLIEKNRLKFCSGLGNSERARNPIRSDILRKIFETYTSWNFITILACRKLYYNEYHKTNARCHSDRNYFRRQLSISLLDCFSIPLLCSFRTTCRSVYCQFGRQARQSSAPYAAHITTFKMTPAERRITRQSVSLLSQHNFGHNGNGGTKVLMSEGNITIMHRTRLYTFHETSWADLLAYTKAFPYARIYQLRLHGSSAISPPLSISVTGIDFVKDLYIICYVYRMLEPATAITWRSTYWLAQKETDILLR